jgi:hypothetical protein
LSILSTTSGGAIRRLAGIPFKQRFGGHPDDQQESDRHDSQHYERPKMMILGLRRTGCFSSMGSRLGILWRRSSKKFPDILSRRGREEPFGRFVDESQKRIPLRLLNIAIEKVDPAFARPFSLASVRKF